MQLLTKELERLFPPHYFNESKSNEEVKIIAKFFCPWNHWTWYATEYNPEERIFFGYVRGDFNEFGYFSLDELQSLKGPFHLTIERDLHFSEHTLADVIKADF